MKPKHNTATLYVKAQGLKSVRQVSELSTVSERTLYNYWNNNQQLFVIIVAGVKSFQAASDVMVIDGVEWVKKLV